MEKFASISDFDALHSFLFGSSRVFKSVAGVMMMMMMMMMTLTMTMTMTMMICYDGDDVGDDSEDWENETENLTRSTLGEVGGLHLF